VALLALLDPSRQDIPEYSEYLGAIQREARRVNDRFQSENWLPIDLRIEDNFPRSVAAYKQFDVLFVNAIFDGLNLVRRRRRSSTLGTGLLSYRKTQVHARRSGRGR
jgi:trehalose 6-phosphate synthase